MNDIPTDQLTDPYEQQRRLHELLAQETRHLIVQFLLGHPAHLISLKEFSYIIPKSDGAIRDQLDRLIDAGLLAEYIYEPSRQKRDLPAKFYGFTERGVEILADFKYLRGLPVAQAVYRNTRRPEHVKRHEEAPRPELPSSVRAALSYDEPK